MTGRRGEDKETGEGNPVAVVDTCREKETNPSGVIPEYPGQRRAGDGQGDERSTQPRHIRRIRVAGTS